MDWISNIEFANKWVLYFLALLPALVLFYILKEKDRNARVNISTLSFFKSEKLPFRLILKHFLFGLRILAMGILIMALARPQSTDSWSETETQGIDIALCMDVSGSMRAMDFNPNRLEAAKDVAIEFINGRTTDRIAVVVFAGESFTLCPLTSDRSVAVNQVNSIDFGLIEDGTAIGSGLATGVNRLKESKAESKVIILLTDGVNNAGTIGPVTAAEIARDFGIRVYAIGVGTLGRAPYPVQGPFGQQIQQVEVKIDEDVLQNIAEITGGKYFRATDNQKLRDIYSEIDQMEKTILNTQDFSKKEEEYLPFLLVGLGILLLELILRYTALKSLA
jgi:Ca-activated chloride channel homolog